MLVPQRERVTTETARTSTCHTRAAGPSISNDEQQQQPVAEPARVQMLHQPPICQSRSSSGSIPDGWLESPPISAKHIKGLAAAKTPLSSNFDTLLAPDRRLNPAALVAAYANTAAVRIVIDLTSTRRYYDPCEIEVLGVKHLKVMTHGRGSMPTDDQMVQILNALRDATSEADGAPSKPPIAIIHCTHGINRTGYVLVRALVELHGYTLIAALTAFAELCARSLDELWNTHETPNRALQPRLYPFTTALPYCTLARAGDRPACGETNTLVSCTSAMAAPYPSGLRLLPGRRACASRPT